MAHSRLNSTPRWTRSKIELPRRPPNPLTEFDDNEGINTVTPRDVHSSVQALEGRVPNYLLLVSLLEHLCSLYENDPEKSQKIFNVLCQQLAKMKVMPPFSFLEEFSVIRAKYKKAFSDLMQAAANETGTDLQGIKSPTSPWSRNFGNLPFGTYSSRALGKMNNLLPSGTSRYKEEFVEMGRLGKGGFGSVLKVKNKLDGREYAVKKVPLKEADPDLCLKILREVKVLARLNHINVVGYHSAWLEYVTTQNAPNSLLPRVATQPVSLKELDDISSRNGVYSVEETSQSSSIVFESSSQSGRDASSSGVAFAMGEDSFPIKRQHNVNDGTRIGKIPSFTNLKNSASRNSFAPYPSNSQSGFRRSVSSGSLASLTGISEKSDSPGLHNSLTGNKTLGMMLFIQMQLCTTTLSDWLQSRNLHGGQIDSDANMAIFRQIVEGVQYIHSQGLMHRDLKPRNIFLQSLTRREDHSTTPLQVKIGDFGLARKDAVLYPDTSSPLASLIEPVTHQTFLPPRVVGLSPRDAPTSGVGTCTYAAPEQLRNTDYANKADMYSLGIILFELYSSFGTEMERVTSIKTLRQGRLPHAFVQIWPEQSELILRLVTADPSCRPSAESVLQNDFVKDKSEVSKQLSEKLEMQAKEIDELKNVLLEKDLELEAQVNENKRLQRELAERSEMIRRLLAARKQCHTCGRAMEVDEE